MDNTFVIDNLLRQNESDVLEFKEKYSPEVIAKNVTAMLNNRGGDILVGITDDKQVIGIDKGVDIGKFLSKLLSEITPSAPIDVQLVDYDLVTEGHGSGGTSGDNGNSLSNGGGLPDHTHSLKSTDAHTQEVDLTKCKLQLKPD